MRNIFVCFIFLIVMDRSLAQVPATLSYQGLLTDAAGMPFKDDPYSIVFRFYKQATGGTEEFSRGPITVTTFKGLFTTMLGNGPGADNAALPYTLGDSQYYIGISVGAQPELTPRVFLTAVPYAFHAQTVSAIDFSSTAVTLTGTVPNARLDANLQDLADGSLTGSKVGTGISATNITTGSLSGSLVGTGISATNITTGTLPNTVLDANLIDLADGSLTGNKVGTGISAANITTGSLTGSLVGSGISASNVTSGTLPTSVIPSTVGVPIGTVISFAGLIDGTHAIPSGWLICDGAKVSRTFYSSLFAALGVTWGVGDNVNTFNLPDLRGYFLRGQGATMNTASANIIL